ncbi:ATP-binding protein [Umezawaea endophytica]|uniref:Nuclease SbcCD subunit C n=2 Tax=Umezawaea endophytica TaxID=1654476 RepID=A0A9X3A052_9PSEU|nr:ATP-binding protein [Umezawaea endophytica]MCS7478184.1 ATP-binding protein [Umezawaea endophytica]
MIRTLTARRFRGIDSEVSVDFRMADGSLGSVLVLGDNGTGKSSIADSLEFCLRGKVSRRGNKGTKTKREAQNYFADGPPWIKVVLNDGSSYSRGFDLNPDKGAIKLGGNEFLPGFSLSPVVLGRSDVEVFWQLNSTEKMRFFFDYLRDVVKHPGYAALQVERTQGKLNGLRSGVLEAQIALSVAASIPIDRVPISSRKIFLQWRQENFPQYKTTSQKFKDSKSGKLRPKTDISPDIQAALNKLESRLGAIYSLQRQLQVSRRDSRSATGNGDVVSRKLPGLLSKVSERVSNDFSAIAGLKHIAAVSLFAARSGYELVVKCQLTSGRSVEPAQVLSEGALDLLAMLILLNVSHACAERGQVRVLALDDVWQSVDSVHRDAILDYLFSARFANWQFLITVHDRLWARLIENKARKFAFKLKTIEIVEWDSESGPRLRSGGIDTPNQLEKLIPDAPPEALCAYTGRALEELSDKLSQTMRTSISRTMGDRYTLEDLWPGVYKSISKSKVPEDLKIVASEINAGYALRNIYGAHYAMWAESTSASEVRRFSRLVVDLWRKAHCQKCGSPLGSVFMGKSREIGPTCNHADFWQ